MSKRRKKHFIEKWCQRRFAELNEHDGDIDKTVQARFGAGFIPAKSLGCVIAFDKDGQRNGCIVPSQPAYFYVAAKMFVDSGMNIYTYDKLAEQEVARTEANEEVLDAAYEHLPFDCVYVAIHHPNINGMFVLKNHQAHEFQWLAVATGGDYTFTEEDRSRLKNIAAYIGTKNADIHVSYRPPVDRFSSRRRQSTATWHDVGIHIGAELREYVRVKSKDATHQGGTVRPHMRRAHWHRYWTGPKCGKQVLVLKWLHPMLIASKNGPIEHPTSHLVPME